MRNLIFALFTFVGFAAPQLAHANGICFIEKLTGSTITHDVSKTRCTSYCNNAASEATPGGFVGMCVFTSDTTSVSETISNGSGITPGVTVRCLTTFTDGTSKEALVMMSTCQNECTQAANSAKKNGNCTALAGTHEIMLTNVVGDAASAPAPVRIPEGPTTVRSCRWGDNQRGAYDIAVDSKAQCQLICDDFMSTSAPDATVNNCTYQATTPPVPTTSVTLVAGRAASSPPLRACVMEDSVRGRPALGNITQTDCLANCTAFLASAAPTSTVKNCTWDGNLLLSGRWPANPVSTDTSRVDNWAVTKTNANKELEKEQIDQLPARFEDGIKQNMAFRLSAQSGFRCVENSYKGRKDSECAADSEHPECVGLERALQLAEGCAEYWEPQTLGCKRYGMAGYTMAEWIAIAMKYKVNMDGCKVIKENNEMQAEYIKLQTDMILFSDHGYAQGPVWETNQPNTPDGTGGPMVNPGPRTSAGGVGPDSGTTPLSTTGASVMGMPSKEILTRALKGDSVEEIVKGSPFFEKLNQPDQELVMNAMANPDETVSLAKERHQALVDSGKEPARGSASTGQSLMPSAEKPKSMLPAMVVDGMEYLGANLGFGEVFSPWKNKPEAVPQQIAVTSSKSVALGKAVEVKEVEEAAEAIANGPKPLLSDRIAAVAAAAKEKMKRQKRGLASTIVIPSVNSAPVSPIDNISLFNRVHGIYRKNNRRMEAMESATARAVRKMPKPTFFKEVVTE